MELYGLESNPVPDGAVVGTAVAADGVRLRYARWRMSGRNRMKGTVCILPGRGEPIEKYFETIEDIRKRGFAVAIVDWRGQGGSERRLKNPMKAHVDSFAEYDRDLEAFLQQVILPDCAPPYFVLAHSMGGLLCLRGVAAGHGRFSRAVLIAPLLAFGPTRPPPPVACRVAATMTAIGLGEVKAPGQAQETLGQIAFDGNRLTGDAARFARAEAIVRELPQIAVGGPTYGWLFAACRALAEAADPAFIASVKLPSLVVAGALDKVVALGAVERLASELRAAGQIVIPGAHHDILMERDAIRDQFFAAFDAFIPGS